MAAPRLPFAFARDEQVVICDEGIVVGIDASTLGLREALRRAGPDAELRQLDPDAFQARLMSVYQTTAEDTPDTEDDSIVLDDATTAPPPRDLLDTSSDAPVIRLVNHLLRRAVEMQASDLHVEPHETGLRARIRVDGFLQTVYDRPSSAGKRVISRLKIMSGLDIAEARLPQDGHIALRYGGKALDVRVSTLPGNYGERVVMRILDKSAGLMPLSDLGLRQPHVETLEALSAAPNGIVLATGPTGSGKTTTLYSLLKLANRSERNIITVEDPVEYDLPGINQSQIHSDIGLTFAAGLRASLRQDPDIILVGEVRDEETASVAAQAALTGHLVFSSLHANSSIAAIVRLRDLGLDDYLIAATVRAIIAQRLLRRLCPSCSTARAPTRSERDAFAAVGMDVPAEVRQAVGCSACLETGHSGRAGIYEIVEIDSDMRALIDDGASEQALRTQAMTPRQSLFGEALGLVADGVTDFAEVVRVVGRAP